ncbi:MAG: hypothetical protein ABEJ84_01930 [Halodesulfurarchaeum sp.]
MSSAQSLGPLERTFNETKPELVQLVVDQTDVEQATTNHLTGDTLAAVMSALGLDVAPTKAQMLRTLRDTHPDLEPDRGALKLSWPELREIYASLERGDNLGGER